MTSPPDSLAVFDAGIAALLAAVFIAAMARAEHSATRASSRRHFFVAACYLTALIPLPAILAGRGALRDFAAFPPPLWRLMLAVTAATLALGLSPVGRRLADEVPLWALAGFQSFRILVELLLWGLLRAGAIPVQMTFEGYNFDILTGLSALPIAWLVWKRRLPKGGLWLWNAFGLALLATIVVIAMLSMPTPLRAFPRGPANAIVTQFPFVWIPCLMVQAGLLGHVLLFRALRRCSPPG